MFVNGIDGKRANYKRGYRELLQKSDGIESGRRLISGHTLSLLTSFGVGSPKMQ
jgi:hypothetical protein